LISLKKYLEMEITQRQAEGHAGDSLLPAVMELYFSGLRAMGKGAVQACPTIGADLEQALAEIETRLASTLTPGSVKEAEAQVGEKLEKWGSKTAEHFQSKANEVKELLIVLAKTAESVGERDQRYATQFSDLTTSLKAIANLDDITQIRSSLVQRATELKSCVDQMSRDTQEAVAHLRAEVSQYETRLQAVEHLVTKDPLTGVANRHTIEGRIDWHISQNETFCVLILDLNRFKEVNDAHGHVAGDDLLTQFAQELQANVRSNDLVGRWGGDEFIVVLACNLMGAKSHIERIQKWVFGKYTIHTAEGANPLEVHVDASIGLAQGQPGKSMRGVIQEADTSMYKNKQDSRKRKT
jgi:diguanylate cyclase (GGDEF)-like protein